MFDYKVLYRGDEVQVISTGQFGTVCYESKFPDHYLVLFPNDERPVRYRREQLRVLKSGNTIMLGWGNQYAKYDSMSNILGVD